MPAVRDADPPRTLHEPLVVLLSALPTAPTPMTLGDALQS